VWLSTKERGFYWLCLILGLAFLLCVLRLVDRPERFRDWIVLGFLGGVGWWTSPQILYFVVPGLIWLAIKLRRRELQLAIPFGAALLGAMPWLIWNLRNHWAAFVPASHQFDQGYIGNIRVLFRHALPVAFGLNAIERWLVPVVFPIIYIVIIVGGTIGVIIRKPKPWFLILFVVAFPLLWGTFPVSGIVGEGRYVMFLLPAVTLLLMYAARHPVFQVLLLVAALAVSVDGVHRIRCCTSPAAPDVAMPRYTGPLINALEAHHVKHFDADYWIAYRVAFETDERIIGSPRGFKRWPPFDRAVDDDPNPPAVFVTRSSLGPVYHRGLVRLQVPYERYDAGDFTVYQPKQKVDFESVMRAGVLK
jgi:hypothetical protein